jgi:hypothetical protein
VGCFKDLSIHRDRQQEAILFYTMLLLTLTAHTPEMDCDQTMGLPTVNSMYATGRELHPRTAQTFVCMNMSVCVGSGCFLCIILVFTKKVYKYLLIMRYLASITQALQVLTYFVVSGTEQKHKEPFLSSTDDAKGD